MKTDTTGKIAYHAIRLKEDGGTDLVQYDFDGSIESITPLRSEIPFKYNPNKP